MNSKPESGFQARGSQIRGSQTGSRRGYGSPRSQDLSILPESFVLNPAPNRYLNLKEIGTSHNAFINCDPPGAYVTAPLHLWKKQTSKTIMILPSHQIRENKSLFDRSPLQRKSEGIRFPVEQSGNIDSLSLICTNNDHMNKCAQFSILLCGRPIAFGAKSRAERNLIWRGAHSCLRWACSPLLFQPLFLFSK